MKRTVENYTFSASGKTVTFTDHPSGNVDLDRVLLVENVTRGVFYYVPGSTSYPATVATNVLTLNSGVSTSGHADGDKLRVLYDYPEDILEFVCDNDTLVANTVATQTLTASGFVPMEVEVTNVTGAAVVYGTLDGSTPSSTNFLFCLPATPCSVVLPCSKSVSVKVISSGVPIVASVLRGS